MFEKVIVLLSFWTN